MSGFVLDASVTLAWLLDDESNAQAEAALEALGKHGAIVPALWHIEVRNSLLVAERRNRITNAEVDDRVGALSELPITLDDTPDHASATAHARKHHLSYYDAIYLELATRLSLPLASLDKRLVKATADEGLDEL